MLRLTIAFLLSLVSLIGFTDALHAGLEISPYVSVSSTKTVKPAEAGKEKSTTAQRTTYGIRAGLSFWRLLRFQLGVGQSKTETETKTGEAVDSWGAIDYEKDLEMSTNDPDKDVKITETRRLATAGFSFDPGFWIFILRAKAGATATQRLIKLEETGEEAQEVEEPIVYTPYAGAGLGVRFTPRIQAMAEYTFNFYDFPNTKTFEREVTVSFVVAIGSGPR